MKLSKKDGKEFALISTKERYIKAKIVYQDGIPFFITDKGYYIPEG